MKKRKKLKYRNILLLLLILLLIGVIMNNKIFKKEVPDNTLTALKEITGYEEQNKDKYLSYISNNNSPLEDTIYLVNNNINYKYSKELVDLSKQEYFIKDNIELYLNNLSNNYEDTIKQVNTKTIYEYYTNQEESDISKDILILVNKYHHLDSSYEPSDLETIDSSYNTGGNNRLRHVAKIAFENMCASALLDNIKLYNVSAYRSYQNQESIYNRYVANKGVELSDKTSARPGNSEHQTGLATDINSLDTDFQYTSEYKWLESNSYKYGFILRYKKEFITTTGYNYEPWHYRYVGEEVAKYIYEHNITYEEYYAYFVEQ